MTNNITDSAGSGISNEKIIEASTRAGFQKPIEENQTNQSNQQNQQVESIKVPKVEDIAKDVKSTNVTKSDEDNAAKVFKLLLSTQLKPFTQKDFMYNNMIFYRYDAKNKDNVYDKSPLIFILRRTGTHTLGLALHWSPLPLRLTLIKYIMQMNRANIRSNLPLKVTYQMLKPVIEKLHLTSVIRLYINSRISRQGLVVPPEYWTSAAKLKAESFTGGYSADALYRMSLQKTKQWKQNRTRRQKL